MLSSPVVWLGCGSVQLFIALRALAGDQSAPAGVHDSTQLAWTAGSAVLQQRDNGIEGSVSSTMHQIRFSRLAFAQEVW